jgi:DNA-binding HxlR family transcriptional regulator
MVCTTARTVNIVGDPWTIMILKEMFLGGTRFDDLQTFTGVSPHLLSVRMRKLEKAGIVRRRAYQARPTRYEYRLTAKGIDLWPIIVAFKNWSERWVAWPDGEPLKIRHKTCNNFTSLKIVCSHCDLPIGARDVEHEMSAAMIKERKTMAKQRERRKTA